MTPYTQFLQRKLQYGADSGFKPNWIPDFLFDFQKYEVDWALRKGRSALFNDCGLGKTPMALTWAQNVLAHTNKPVLILTPLAVANQFCWEALKFDIFVYGTKGTLYKGINVTNYEKLHKFSPHDFAGVVCDESSCLKAFDGKRRAQVTEFLRTIPYRLMTTATAAPNDYVELGTTSEALGVMGHVDMLNRFFKNDNNTSDTKGRFRGFKAPREWAGPRWRFKGHARVPFWQWVPSWARAARRPSDLGAFDDGPFILPELIEREHIVETKTLAEGRLFPTAATNMREELEERRRTITERCEKVAELVSGTGKPFISWCQLNPEGDLLEQLIPDAVQIAGSDSDEEKEEKYTAFLKGQARGMISKQKIGGWGLNCQHCAHVVEFATHSFEAHYQGVRRCWRFGQKNPVINDIIATEGEQGAKVNMQRKSIAASKMFDAIVEHMHAAVAVDVEYKFEKEFVAPSWLS